MKKFIVLIVLFLQLFGAPNVSAFVGNSATNQNKRLTVSSTCDRTIFSTTYGIEIETADEDNENNESDDADFTYYKQLSIQETVLPTVANPTIQTHVNSKNFFLQNTSLTILFRCFLI